MYSVAVIFLLPCGTKEGRGPRAWPRPCVLFFLYVRARIFVFIFSSVFSLVGRVEGYHTHVTCNTGFCWAVLW